MGGGERKTESRDLKDLNALDGNALTHAVIRKRLEPAPPTLIYIVRQPADNRTRETSGAVEVPTECNGNVREEERTVIAVGYIEPAERAAEELGPAGDLVETQRRRRNACGRLARPLPRVSVTRLRRTSSASSSSTAHWMRRRVRRELARRQARTQRVTPPPPPQSVTPQAAARCPCSSSTCCCCCCCCPGATGRCGRC
jgi:hypothetical protein